MAIGVFSLLEPMDIVIKSLVVKYEQQTAINNLSTVIKQGEWVGVVGSNGTGKSTLLNTIAGTTRIFSGEIEGFSKDSVVYLPQKSNLDVSFPITVLEFVSMAFWENVGFFKKITKIQHSQCLEAITAVGLEGLERNMLSSLSGGQFQRCLFARVLIQNKPIVLLDEPFNAVDATTQGELTDLVTQWHKNNRTIVMVSHNLEYVSRHCTSCLKFSNSGYGYGNTENVLTKASINDISARSLNDNRINLMRTHGVS